MAELVAAVAMAEAAAPARRGSGLAAFTLSVVDGVRASDVCTVASAYGRAWVWLLAGWHLGGASVCICRCTTIGASGAPDFVLSCPSVWLILLTPTLSDPAWHATVAL